MRKPMLCCAGILSLVPMWVQAQDRPVITVVEIAEIKAPPATVWGAVKKFDGLKDWCPPFAKSDITKGKDGDLGAVRHLTVKDGPIFDETLTALSNDNMSFTYVINEPAPVPVTEYVSTVAAKANGGGGTTVVWQGSFKRRNASDKPPEGESDAGVFKFIDGLYLTCLASLKKGLEK